MVWPLLRMQFKPVEHAGPARMAQQGRNNQALKVLRIYFISGTGFFRQTQQFKNGCGGILPGAKTLQGIGCQSVPIRFQNIAPGDLFKKIRPEPLGPMVVLAGHAAIKVAGAKRNQAGTGSGDERQPADMPGQLTRCQMARLFPANRRPGKIEDSPP